MYYMGVGKQKTNTKMYEKLGSIFYWGGKKVFCINLFSLSFWLNKGCLLKSSISWCMGLLSNVEKKLKDGEIKLK